jgi:hypothetical protein
MVSAPLVSSVMVTSLGRGKALCPPSPNERQGPRGAASARLAGRQGAGRGACSLCQRLGRGRAWRWRRGSIPCFHDACALSTGARIGNSSAIPGETHVGRAPLSEGPTVSPRERWGTERRLAIFVGARGVHVDSKAGGVGTCLSLPIAVVGRQPRAWSRDPGRSSVSCRLPP